MRCTYLAAASLKGILESFTIRYEACHHQMNALFSNRPTKTKKFLLSSRMGNPKLDSKNHEKEDVNVTGPKGTPNDNQGEAQSDHNEDSSRWQQGGLKMQAMIPLLLFLVTEIRGFPTLYLFYMNENNIFFLALPSFQFYCKFLNCVNLLSVDICCDSQSLLNNDSGHFTDNGHLVVVGILLVVGISLIESILPIVGISLICDTESLVFIGHIAKYKAEYNIHSQVVGHITKVQS